MKVLFTGAAILTYLVMIISYDFILNFEKRVSWLHIQNHNIDSYEYICFTLPPYIRNCILNVITYSNCH